MKDLEHIFFHRHLLHHCFQALMDHGVKVASVLANSFSRRCSYIAESDAHVKEKAIQFGFVLGMVLWLMFLLFQLIITSTVVIILFFHLRWLFIRCRLVWRCRESLLVLSPAVHIT